MKECCRVYLDEQFGGDADVVGEIYGEYVSSVGEKLGEADAARAAEDWGQLDRVAHTIKGNALTAGDGAMAEAAIALRKASALKDPGEASSISWMNHKECGRKGKKTMEAYAVLETGGKQVLVKVGDKIEIEKLSVEAGQDAELTTVLAVSDGTTLKVGKPYVEGAKVVLSVAGVVKGDKVINFKAKRRKGSRRLVGHRQQLTVATVKAIA